MVSNLKNEARFRVWRYKVTWQFMLPLPHGYLPPFVPSDLCQALPPDSSHDNIQMRRPHSTCIPLQHVVRSPQG